MKEYGLTILSFLVRIIIVMCIPIARQWVGNTFPQKQTCGTTGCLFLGNGPVNMHSRQETMMFSMGYTLRLYNEDVMQLELELGQVLEMADKGD
jgi:hypothetical protein